MASSAAIKAGAAYVELFADDSRLGRGLKSAEARIAAFGKFTTRIGKGLFTAGGGVLGAFLPAITAASNMEQTLGKFRATFADEADPALKWAEEFRKQIGRSKLETIEGLSMFQAFFKGLGVGGKEAAALSKKMQTLAIDFASFHNMSDAEALERFISALSGSSEVVDRFGINLKVGALEPAVEKMFGKSFKDASELEKTLARISEIERNMGGQGAIGSTLRETDSFEQQLKRLKAAVLDLRQSIGTGILPIVTEYVKQLTRAVGPTMQWAQSHQELVKQIFQLAAGTTVAGGAMIILGKAVEGAAAAFNILITVGGFLIRLGGIKTLALTGAILALGWAAEKAYESFNRLNAEAAKLEEERQQNLPRDLVPQTMSPEIRKYNEERGTDYFGGPPHPPLAFPEIPALQAPDFEKVLKGLKKTDLDFQQRRTIAGTFSQFSERMYPQGDPELVRYMKEMVQEQRRTRDLLADSGRILP